MPPAPGDSQRLPGRDLRSERHPRTGWHDRGRDWRHGSRRRQHHLRQRRRRHQVRRRQLRSRQRRLRAGQLHRHGHQRRRRARQWRQRHHHRPLLVHHHRRRRRGAGNVISGNQGSGVFITGANASGNVVQGDLLGADHTGLLLLPNTGYDIDAESYTGTLTVTGAPWVGPSTSPLRGPRSCSAATRPAASTPAPGRSS